MAKLHVISCHVLWREICYYASISPNTFNFHFLKQGLHDTPDKLRKELQSVIDSLKEDYSAVLIGYGLCSNGIAGIKPKKIKLVIMRAHDCITFLLGSKEKYKDYFDKHPGTYWYSPGWIETGSKSMPGRERREKLLQEYKEKYGEDNAEYLMEVEQGWFKNYSNAAYVDLNVGDGERFREYTKRCADELSWAYDEISGNPRLLINFLNGNWEEENFLIVEPGHTVIATHDERIIEAKRIET
ncbi:MAG: DUF1638 domain-containing protein [bacterium]